jgi:hypothetical protein
MKRVEVIILLLFILALSILAIVAPRLILIKNIDCQSQYGPCNTLINDAVSEVKKGSLKDTNSSLKEVLKNNVFIIERNPRFCLEDFVSGKYYLVDNSGLILSIVENTNLPKLTIDDGEQQVGERVTREQLFALNILEAVYSTYEPTSATIENKHLLVELEDGVKIIFPLEGDRNTLVGSMFFIMSKLKGGEVTGSKVAIIDLQYKSPVLTLK